MLQGPGQESVETSDCASSNRQNKGPSSLREKIILKLVFTSLN